MALPKEDLTGMKFGKWTVIEYVDNGEWLIECDCENKTRRTHKTSTLKSGLTKSCVVCNRAKLDENYFDTIDTEEKAYVLGFLCADGCNYEKEGRVKIDLQIDDLAIIEKIQKCLGHDGNIKFYEQPNKIFDGKEYPAKTQARLVINNRHLSEQLADKGCIAHKSKYFKFPNENQLPEYLYNHFIRGYLDGNGSIVYWIDTPRTGHKKFSVSITSTIDSAKFLQKYIGDNFNCKPDVRSRFKDRDNNNASVSLCGNRVIERFLNWIYKDSTIHLERKHNKYLELLEMNNK